MTTQFPAPTIPPAVKPLGVVASLKAVRNNVLNIIPAIAYTQPIVTGTTGPARWHMVQGPEGMKRVFLDNVGNYPKSEVMIRMLRPAVGRSLFTSEGAEWRWQRRAIAPVFAARNVDALAPMMSETAERVVAQIGPQGGTFPAVETMMKATFDVICDVALSGRDHFNSDAYAAAITKYFLTVGRASLLDFMRVPPWFPRPAELTGSGAVRTMHRMVAKAIDERRQTGAGAVDDLLDHMLAATDPNSGRAMTPKELLYNMQFFIVAGHETTALTIAWALLMLASDQDAQTRAIEEAQKARDTDQLGANAVDLPFINAVLQETLRLYPPVGMLARDALGPDNLCGRDVRKRDTVFLNIYAMHRHDMYWEAPHAFLPERFLPEEVKSRDKYLHLPFGAGPRICVGANFAMLQASVILANLLANFRFTLAGEVPKPVMHMTIRPEPDIHLRASPA